jgi:hypothetical protein
LALIPLPLDLQLWSHDFAPSHITRSEPLANALRNDRDKVVAMITKTVKDGSFIFAHPG